MICFLRFEAKTGPPHFEQRNCLDVNNLTGIIRNIARIITIYNMITTFIIYVKSL